MRPIRRSDVLSKLSIIFAILLGSGAALFPALTQAAPRQIRSAEIRGERDHAELVIIGAMQDPPYVVQTQDEGRTVILDVEGVSLPPKGLRTRGKNALVNRAVASTTARGARIELSLAPGVTYHVRSAKNRIVVQLYRLDSEYASKSAVTKKNAQVRDVRIEKRNGRERVVIELRGTPDFRISERPDAPPRLEVIGAGLAKGVATQQKGGERSAIRSVRVEERGDRTSIEVVNRGQLSGTAIRSGKRILWVFPEAGQQNERPSSRTIAKDRDFAKEVAAPEVAGFWSKAPKQIAGSEASKYSGRRIDLDFKDADIHNILRLIAEVGDVNIITSDDVSGSVTIRMKNVPWDQALEVILTAKALGMVRKDNLLRVAPLSMLEQEREAEIARQKQQQQLAPLETRLIPVSYAAANNLSGRVQELLSSRGSVSVDTRTNMLIVRDVTDQLAPIEQLVRSLDTQTPQVLVEARVVEASSQYSREVGIQWGGDFTMSGVTGNPTGLSFPSSIGIAGGVPVGGAPTQGLSPFTGTVGNPNFAVNLPAVTGNGAGGSLGLTLGSVDGNVNLSVRLSAAESSGNVRIISSPRILTLDNHTASISQGTLIPYETVSQEGTSVQFQNASLELTVLPHVTNDGSISMEVQINRDEPDFGRTAANGVPTILKRQAQTNLLIPDGNTAVIGGIYTRNTGRTVAQVPFFGDIPVLGVFFKRRSVRDDRNELLIFLTPRIVNRSASLPS